MFRTAFSPSRSDQSRSDQSRSDQSRSDQSRSDQLARICRHGAAATAVAACLAGCGAAVPPAGAPASTTCRDAAGGTTTVVTATATAAEPGAGLPRTLRSRLRATALQGRPTCVVVVAPDGTLAARDVAPRRPNGDLDHGPDRQRKVDVALDTLDRDLESLAESRPGLDVVRAVDQAVRLSPGGTDLVVISSGVSTSDPVDLRNLGWDFDADRESRLLAERHEVPDLSGWRVTFVGLGTTAGTQPVPTIALRRRVEAIWTAVCTAARARQCSVDAELLPPRSPAGHNVVPVVPLPAPIVGPGRVVIPGVLFGIGSAAVDPGAENVLRDVVEHCTVTGSRVRVAGHTDAVTGTPAFNRRLSQQRADAVTAWLLAHGLPPDRVAASIGLGQTGADARRERDDPRLVATDRNVEITYLPEETSEDAATSGRTTP